MNLKKYLTAVAMLACASIGFAQPAAEGVAPRSAVSFSESAEIYLQHTDTKKVAKKLPDLIVFPDGTRKDYLQAGDGIYYFLGIVPAQDPYSEMSTHFVYSDDSDKVYIYNIIPRFPTTTYVEGTIQGDSIVVTFPQGIKIEKRDGAIYDYYVDRLEREIVEENQATYWPSAQRTVSYYIKEDGSVEMAKSAGEWAIGVTNNDGLWQGYADWNVVYTPNKYELVTPPEGKEVEPLLFISNYTGHEIGAIFDGSDVYLKGVCKLCPEAWVKGKLDGSKITFENAQYIGNVPGYNRNGFFFGGVATPDPKYVWAYSLSDNFVMDYDAETKTMTTDQTIIINSNDQYLNYMTTYIKPIVHPDKEDHSEVPQNIAPVSYNPYGLSGNCIGFKFYVPNLTVDNYLIPKDELYWSIYIDDEIYTFEPYLFEGLKKDMTEVPFNCDVEDIENKGEIVLHTLYLPIEDFEKVGYVSLRRMPGVEEPLYSEIVEFLNPEHAAVETLPSEAGTSERIFDLNGLPVANPVKGHIYIVDKGTKTIKRIY